MAESRFKGFGIRKNTENTVNVGKADETSTEFFETTETKSDNNISSGALGESGTINFNNKFKGLKNNMSKPTPKVVEDISSPKPTSTKPSAANLTDTTETSYNFELENGKQNITQNNIPRGERKVQESEAKKSVSGETIEADVTAEVQAEGKLSAESKVQTKANISQQPNKPVFKNSFAQLKQNTMNESINEVNSATKFLSVKGYHDNIPLDTIYPAQNNKFNENDTDEDIRELADSIKANGLLHNLVLNKKNEDYYEIISGEKRYKAVSLLKWKTVPATVYDNIDSDRAEIMLIEANLKNREYSASQKLKFFIKQKEILDRIEKNEGISYSKDDLANLMKVSTKQIQKYQNIVNYLPQEKQKDILDGKLSINEADQLAKETKNNEETRKTVESITPSYDTNIVSDENVVEQAENFEDENKNISNEKETQPQDEQQGTEYSNSDEKVLSYDSNLETEEAETAVLKENVKPKPKKDKVVSPLYQGVNMQENTISGNLFECENRFFIVASAKMQENIKNTPYETFEIKAFEVYRNTIKRA